MTQGERHEAEWTRDELEFIDLNAHMSLEEMSSALGKDPVLVSRARARIESSVLSDPWTVEDDAFILATPNLTAAQVAHRLGRTTTSINTRRKLLSEVKGVTFGEHGSNKSPFQIAARPLIAKTCVNCGRLLPADWFSFSPKQNRKGGWKSQCRACMASATSSRTAVLNKDLDKYRQKTRESRKRLQELTIPHAERAGREWLEAEHEVLRDPDLTLVEKALRLRRTYNAVAIVCSTYGYKSHVGLGDAERDIWVIENPNQPPSAMRR